jgi:hypothetical protein
MSDLQNAITIGDATERQKLHKLLSDLLITVADQMFQNQDIYIDGYRFINCSFINCRLFINRGTFEFHHCFLKDGIRLWGDDAMKCIQCYTLWAPQWQASSGFAAKMHPDGTFSIGKGVSIS